jgi:hypothetical protein
MARNSDDDLIRWYGHGRYYNLQEAPSLMGDCRRSSACVSTGAVHEIAGTILTTIFHRLFFFIIMISVLATSKKASNADVWQTFINAGGWPNNGVSFCIGFLTPAFALAGVDGVVHMSEEAHHASVNIPRAMIWSVVINGLAGFAFILTILYAITDINEVLTIGTNTGYPIIGVFLQATSNPHAATAMLCAVIIIFTMALFGIQASASRLTWAFARDQYVFLVLDEPYSSTTKGKADCNLCTVACRSPVSCPTSHPRINAQLVQHCSPGFAPAFFLLSTSAPPQRLMLFSHSQQSASTSLTVFQS